MIDIMKIAIKFGDNGYYTCFYGILETIKNARKFNDKVTEDKELLCKIINELSYGTYLLYQNSFEYNEEKSGELCLITKDYLQITPEQILLNDEVQKYLEEVGCGGGNFETYIFDSDLDSVNSDQIYSH